MGIRLKPEEKKEFKRLFEEAVLLQAQLFDKLRDIENLDGVGTLTGLDSIVSEEAVSFTVCDGFSDRDINFFLRTVEREG